VISFQLAGWIWRKCNTNCGNL